MMHIIIKSWFILLFHRLYRVRRVHVTVPNELRNYFWSVELWTGTEPDGICLARRGDVIISSQSMRSGEPQKRGNNDLFQIIRC